MSEQDKPTIEVEFKLLSLQPDRRQYKPSNPLLEPIKDFIVLVNVPLDKEYISNSIKILEKQLSSGNAKVPEPVFTPTGLKFIVDQFELAMSEPEEEPITDEPLDETDWEDEGETWEEDESESEEWKDDSEEELSWEDEEETWEEEDETSPEDTPDEEELEWTEEDL